VLVDGKPARACLILLPVCEGRSVTTIEGLSGARSPLHPIQKAILEKGLQCGFCVPGIVLAAKALLDETSTPDETQIRESLSGHMCRCSGFQSFVAAIQAVAEGQYD
jgi:carbon-monoxide dehydrogenase small subunit